MKVLIIAETEEFFCFHARTEIYNKWKCIETFQEVNKETITLISSGVNKTWPVQVRGNSSSHWESINRASLQKQTFQHISCFIHIFVCIKYLQQDQMSLFKAAVKGEAMPQLTDKLQKSLQDEIFEQKSKEGWNQPRERSSTEFPPQKKQ